MTVFSIFLCLPRLTDHPRAGWAAGHGPALLQDEGGAGSAALGHPRLQMGSICTKQTQAQTHS